jgi:hypothetical protein
MILNVEDELKLLPGFVSNLFGELNEAQQSCLMECLVSGMLGKYKAAFYCLDVMLDAYIAK